MNGIIFPASPNWYCSKVSDCNEDGKYVFAARNKLHVVDFSGGDLRFSGSSWEVHVERCCSLSLCQIDGFRNLCCTCGDDGLVRVWNIDTRSLVHEYDGGRDKLTTVHWSPLDSDLVIICDEKGSILSWRPKKDEVLLFTPEKGCVSAVACSPHDAWHVAVGYKHGAVFLYDLHRDGTILHRLRGHDEEILSIVWCPVLGEADTEKTDSAEECNDKIGCLLATGSRDRSIRVWSSSTGRIVQSFTLPTNTGHRRERFDDGRNRAWVTLSWPKQMPESLLSSSHGGELLIWDIWKKSKQKWRVVDAQGEIRNHWRTIFNISVANNYCFTISMDRQLCMWDLSDLKCIASRPTMGGFIYTMVNSPVNPGNMAIGVGDQVIRLLNVSQPANLNKVTNLWQGIKSKVTALSWHPAQENLLAYGTDDGRVGVYDAFKNKPPVMAHSFHKGTVYSITFGPPCSAPGTPVFKTSHALYSCGDGIINLHNPSHLDTKAVNTNEIIMKTNQTKHCLKRSEIRWKVDQSVAAIGNEDGSVEIVCVPDLKILCVIHSTKKLVNTIQWHPEYTTNLGQEQSKLHTWLAIGSNDSSIHVIDWVKTLSDKDIDQHQIVTESIRVLTGHTARVTCLSWSDHREGMLASASYDRTVQVWNVIANEPVANYRGHNGILLSVLWHPLEDDVIFSGSDDFTVHCWKPSELEEKVPPPKGSDVGNGEKPRKKKKKKSKGGRPPPAAGAEQAPDIPALDTVSFDETSRSELMDMLEQKRLEITKAGESNRTKTYENGDSEEVVVIERLNFSNMEVKPDAVFRKVEDSLGGATSAAAENAGAGDFALLAERKKKLTEVLGLEDEKPSDDSKVLLPKRDTRNMKVRKRRLLFPLGNEMENNGKLRLVEDCLNIAYLTFGTASAELKSLVTSGKLTHLGTFIDKSALYKMVTIESEHHLAHGHIESYVILEIWKGNIAEMLQVAEEHNQLSDFLISMASFSKHPTFLATCEAYAKQLEKCDNFMKATCYYLVCFKVYEAIDMLVKNRLFKEAVVLSRLRLPSQDPKIEELFIAWANHLINDLRTPEQAAKCYLAVGNPEEAMRILTRRNDIVGFKNASKIAFICQKDELGEEYARKMSHLCLQNYDWKVMNELIEKQDQLKDTLLLGVVHKKLCHELKKLNLLEATLQECEESTPVLDGDKADLPEIILNADVTDSMVPWTPVVVNRQSFLHDVLKTWYHQCDLKMEESAVKELYDRTSRFKPTVGELAHLTYRQGLVHVSSHLSLVILALLLGDKTAALNHMLDAMVICFDQKLDKLLQGVCNTVLPLGPEYISQFFQEVQAVKLAARYDGSVSSTSASTIAEIGKQEVQQEAITAYYCWSVVKYVLQNLETEECRKEAGKAGKGDVKKLTDEAGADVNEERGEGDSAKTELCQDVGTKQGSLEADIGGAGDSVKSKGTHGAKVLGYITPIRIDSFFQVLLHKIQSRRFMCTEKLAYIESAIKVVQERTKDKEMNRDDQVLPAITLPPITPRTPIPSVCIDDGEIDNVGEHESSPDHVELKIGGSESGGASKNDSVQVMYKKTLDTNTLGNDAARPSRSNGVGPGRPGSSLNTSLSASSTIPGSEGSSTLFPFTTPSAPDDSIIGASPGVEVEGDYVEMDKLRAWASARKRHSDFALMMFKDCFSYDNVPEEWYQMPASEKYTKDCITMDILVNEKDQVSKQLAEVAYFVKDVPFPNPHLSSKVLLDICRNLRNIHKKEVSSYIETIKVWIKENGVTREHLNWIEANT
ncbi:gem-associated protein 5-like [Lineus longissimus]|uniref:gem-associated protein 5-like n=1 Tax=Lineus longissimus TaxID=88925 RepID=UPI002B4F94A7